MPQLMPLFWIMSTILVLLLLFMYLKVHGSFISISMINNSDKFNATNYKWYW